MTTLSVHPDLYLDRREPAWLVHERAGLVRYDPVTKVVRVSPECQEIVHSLTVSA